MLPHSLRLDLRNYSDFFKNVPSRRFGGLRFFWQVEKNTQNSKENNLSPTRFAIIVKKKHGNAPQRAKTKRLVRHAIVALHHQEPQLFNTPQSVAILVQGKPQTQADYEKSIKQFLQEQTK